MKRRTELPELLAPAGDLECLEAAIAAGADAIYVGGRAFNARAYAKNFDDEQISYAVTLCHLHGVRLYVTLNTLLYDSELDEAVDFARRLQQMGVDALIVADLGLVDRLHKELPTLELHASTQMSVHNSDGADMAAILGCSRVVVARELSYRNICEVTAACAAETEVFLHGALCVCHSGQCLFSSLVGGRSGNRGECAQPCRLPYGAGKYPLSLSDLSLADHIRELVDSGVASLKIEGRMKSPDYVYNVTSTYRRLLDRCRPATKEEKRLLEMTFSRGGFTDGYFKGKPSVAMTGIRSEEDKRASRALNTEVPPITKPKISACALILEGKPAELSLTLRHPTRGTLEARAKGEIPMAAINAPITEDALIKRICKMGATPFELSEEDVCVTLDDGLMLPVSAINALRREAAAELTELLRSPSEYAPCPFTDPSSENEKLREMYTRVKKNAENSPVIGEKTALVLKPSLLDGGDFDYFDTVFLPLTDFVLDPKGATGVYLPPVIMQDEMAEVRGLLQTAKEKGAVFALIGNLGALDLAASVGLSPVADFRFNVMNSRSKALVGSFTSSAPVLSVELGAPALLSIGGRAVVYGRIPLMLTERCFVKENFGCDKCGKAALEDRKGASFPIVREYKHRNLILNSAVTYVGDKPAFLSDGRLSGSHFIFCTETPAEAKKIIDAYRKSKPFPLSVPMRRIGRREVQKGK